MLYNVAGVGIFIVRILCFLRVKYSWPMAVQLTIDETIDLID